MNQEYEIYFGSERIGTADVSKEGLYYRIRCQCTVSGSVPMRIVVTGQTEADLGLCVPMGDHFGLQTRIPVKRIGEGELRFSAKTRHSVAEEFQPVHPEEPFGYISRLKDAYLVKRGSQNGIAWKHQSDNSKPTGQ